MIDSRKIKFTGDVSFEKKVRVKNIEASDVIIHGVDIGAKITTIDNTVGVVLTTLPTKQDLIDSENRLNATHIGTGTVSNTNLSTLEGNVRNITDALADKQDLITSSSKLSTTLLDYTAKIDTSNIDYSSRINCSYLGSGNVSNEVFDHLIGSTSSLQNQLNSLNAVKEPTISEFHRINATFLGTGDVNNTQLSSLNSITSNVQTQLDGKQSNITSDARLNANLVGDGSVSSAQYGKVVYLETVGTNVQEQIDAKQASITSGSRLNSNLIADGSISNENYQKLVHLSSVTSNVKTDIDSKQSTLDASNRLNAAFIGTGGVSSAVFDKVTYLSNITQDIQTSLNTLTSSKEDNISSSNRVDASHVGTGLVTNTTFNYLQNVESDIQSQLNTLAGAIGGGGGPSFVSINYNATDCPNLTTSDSESYVYKIAEFTLPTQGFYLIHTNVALRSTVNQASSSPEFVFSWIDRDNRFTSAALDQLSSSDLKYLKNRNNTTTTELLASSASECFVANSVLLHRNNDVWSNLSPTEFVRWGTYPNSCVFHHNSDTPLLLYFLSGTHVSSGNFRLSGVITVTKIG